MVAVFVGQGAGYARGSGSLLGGPGLLGSGTLGRAGESVSVNAATGNLLISQQDEFLIGRGLDIAISRTYNSMGDASDGDNGDNWQQSTTRRVFGLTGTQNTAGSTIKRQGADGAVITYSWDAARSAYLATDGNGAHDELRKVAGNWVWTDGSSRFTDTYAAYGTDNWRIIKATEKEAFGLSFTYVGDKLDKVTTANGEWTQYIWSGNNITQIVTGYTDLATSTATTLTRTRYAYDSSNRLSRVTVDLSPEDNSVTSGRTFVTDYTYDASNRVASITTTGGSKIEIAYDTSGRVQTLTETVDAGPTRVTELSYQTGYTEVTGPDSKVTRLSYDASNQLVRITAPAATGSGLGQFVEFEYDAAGNVTKVKDSAGKITSYTHDSAGNVLTVTDPNSNVVTRTYSAKNELLTETRTGSDASGAEVSHTTRYVYNAISQLRYMVSAEGHVIEYEWQNDTQYWTTEYPQQIYDVSGLADDAAITESQLTTWRTTFNNTRDKITFDKFDARGNLTKRTRYGSGVSNWGNGSLAEGYSESSYSYDQSGRLLARYENGVLVETFVYDGLGRVVASSSPSSGVTTVRFDDANSTTLIHYSTGLTQTKVYNKAGDLISDTSSTPGYQPDDLLGDLSNWGVTRVTRTGASAIDGKPAYTFTLDATGNQGVIGKSMAVAAGETVTWRIAVKGNPADTHRLGLHGTVGGWGTLAGTDASAVVISGPGSVKHSGSQATLLELTGLSETQETIIELRRTFTQAEGVYAYFYVGVGASVPAGTAVTLGAANLTRTVTDTNEAISSTTAYRYDALGRVRMITTPRGVATAGNPDDYNSFILYDHAGRKTADIAADGSVVEYRYDAAGRLAATIAYANKLNAVEMTNLAATGGITEISAYRPLASASGDIWSWNVYDDAGRLIQSIDGTGGVVDFFYDKSDRLIQTIGYAAKLTAAALNNLKATPPTTRQTVPTGSEAENRISRTFYDKDGRLVGTLNGEGYLSEIVYDKAGQKVQEIAYATRPTVDRTTSSFNQLRTSAGTGVATNRRVHYVYDGQGLLRYQVDSLGFFHSFTYDNARQLTTTIAYATAIAPADFAYTTVKAAVTSAIANDPANRRSWSVYNNKGQVAYAIDAGGLVTAFTYDGAGRAIKTVQFAALRSTTALPALATMETWAAANAGDSANRTVRNYYNAAGELRFTVDAEGYRTEHAYDAEGNLLRTALSANPVSVTDATTIAALAALPAGTTIATTYAYDPMGRLARATDAEDGSTTYEYNAFGQVAKATDARGKATYSYYDAAGRLAMVRDAENYVTQTSYNSFGEVASVTRFANKATNAASAAVPTLATDPAKDATTFHYYDDLGRLTYTVDAEKGVTRSYYNGFGEVAKVVRYATPYAATAATTIGQLDISFGTEAAAPPGTAAVTQYVHDNRGFVTSTTDAGGYLTTSAYNGFGLLTSVTRGTATTSFEYDKRGQVTRSTDAEDFFESYGYDAFGNRTSVTAKSNTAAKVAGGTTTYTYDKRGLLLSETLPIAAYRADGSEQASSITNKYRYDGRGNRIESIEAFGLTEARTTSFEYDKLDRLKKTTFQSFQGHVPAETVAYDAAGNVTRTVDAANSRTVHFYDDLGRRRMSVDMAGTVSSFVYDAYGNVTETRVYETKLTVIPDDGGAFTSVPSEVADSGSRVTTFTYDRVNRLKTSSVGNVATGSWNGSTWVPVTDALTTTYVYDAFGNVVKTIDPNQHVGGVPVANATATWAYYDKLGRKTHQVDALNYLTVWSYDAEGNVLSEKRYSVAVATPTDTATLPVAPGVDNAMRETLFTYDKNGNRLSEARTGIHVHDGSGGVEATAVTVTISWLYNGLGQVVQKNEATDDPGKARGEVGDESTYYSYDLGGRLLEEERAAFASHQGVVRPIVDYRYNGVGDLAQTVQRGVTIADDRITSYTYAGGKLVSTTDAALFVRQYKYDVMGRVTHDYYTRLKSDGTPANAFEGTLTSYDAVGRVIEQWQATSTNAATWAAASPILSTRYNAFGEVEKTGLNAADVVESNKLWQTQNKYDAAGRLWATTAGDGIWKYFGHDRNGNQTAAITNAGYDAFAGLSFADARALATHATHGAKVNATYTVYDKRNMAISTVEEGRQLSATVTRTIVSERSYNAFGEALTETAPYDPTDVTTQRAVTTYSYNKMGRVIRTEGPAVQMTRENGATLWIRASQDYYYDRSGRLVATRDANGTYADNVGNSETNPATKTAHTGNLTRLTLLAGTGYDGGQALVTQQIAADNGIQQTRYDIHGDARLLVNELGYETEQIFDKLGRLTQRKELRQKFVNNDSNQGLNPLDDFIDNYTYDILGQLLVRWNGELGSGNKETNDYDVQGRVVSSRAYGGDITTTTYVWDAAIAANGLGILSGGWIATTSAAADRASSSDYIYAVVEKTDVYGRTVDRIDAGGQDFEYLFDTAGRLLHDYSDNRLGSPQRKKIYSYFNTGQVATIDSGDAESTTSTWNRNVATYSYDVAGNQLTEKLVHHWGQYDEGQWITLPEGSVYLPASYTTGSELVRDGRATYDLKGRMVGYRDVAASGPDNVNMTWRYDANGNIRHIHSDYRSMQANATLATSTSTIDHWYLYDSMNRVVTSKGVLIGSTITRSTVGTDLSYDAAGRRMTAQTGFGAQESYTYNAAGLVTAVAIGSVTRATTSFDTLGRITGQVEYDAFGIGVYDRYGIVYDGRSQILAEKSKTKQGSDWIYAHMVNHYSADGTGSVAGPISSSASVGWSTGSVLLHSETKYWKNGSAYPVYNSSADFDYPDSYSHYYYIWTDGPLQSKVSLTNRDGVTSSTYHYDSDTYLSKVELTGGARPRTINYTNNAGGQIVARSEIDNNYSQNDPSSRSYFFAGRQMGEVSNNGTENVNYATWIADRTNVDGTGAFREGSNTASIFADFDQQYVALNGGVQGSTPGVYRVRAGDTLQGIAAQLWGDASLWYKLAEANGFTGNEALFEGRSLAVPQGLINSHNNAETFKPYDPAKAIGDVNPNTPKPPKQSNKCGVFGMVLIAVIAVAATVVTAGAALSGIGAVQGGILGGMQAFLGIGGATIGAVGGISGGVLAAGAGAFGAAVGSAVSQGVAVAAGIQNNFSWKNVGLAALGGAVGGAIGPNGLAGSDGLFSGIGSSAGAKIAAAGLRGATGSALTQGIGRIAGLQSKFDFAGVAAAGVGAAAGVAVSRGLADKGIMGLKAASDSMGNAIASISASAIANAATRSAINGENFGRNLVASIPDVMAQLVSRAVATAFDDPIASKNSSSGGGGSARAIFSELRDRKRAANPYAKFATNIGYEQGAHYSSSYMPSWVTWGMSFVRRLATMPGGYDGPPIIVNGIRWAAEMFDTSGPLNLVAFNIGLSQNLGQKQRAQRNVYNIGAGGGRGEYNPAVRKTAAEGFHRFGNAAVDTVKGVVNWLAKPGYGEMPLLADHVSGDPTTLAAEIAVLAWHSPEVAGGTRQATNGDLVNASISGLGAGSTALKFAGRASVAARAIPAAETIITREGIVGALGEVVQPRLSDIAKLDPDALVGFRGSLASGFKGTHKGGAPFDPTHFDIDAFIVSDKLAGQFGSKQWFRSGADIDGVASVQQSIEASLRQNPMFSGLKQEPLNFRIWTQSEMTKLQAKPGTQYFFIKPK